MPAYLTHFRILQLAMEWLESVGANPQAGQDLKNLAQEAVRLLRAGEVPSAAPNRAISKTAHFGSVGPDFVSAAAFFAPGKQYAGGPESKWAGEKALHDDDVLGAHTTNVILDFIGRIPPASRDALMGYALGYMTHVAGDVIVHPYVNAFRNDSDSHSKIEVNQDSLASRQYFGHDDVHSGESWTEYLFEEESGVVDQVLTVFNEAFVHSFFPGMSGDAVRPAGVSEDLAMSKDFLDDGYSTTRDVVLDIVYDWSPWEFYWLPSLIFMAVTMGAVLFFWFVCKESTSWGDLVVMTSFEAANMSSWVVSTVFSLVLFLIFRYGLTQEIVISVIFTCVTILMMVILTILKAKIPAVKQFMSQVWVRVLLFFASFFFSWIPFWIQLANILNDQEVNLVSFISSASSLGFLVIAGVALGITLPVHGGIDETREKIDWPDLLISGVSAWIWGFFTHLVGVISIYPPTDPDAKFSGPLGSLALDLRNGQQQAPAADLPIMMDKAKVFAAILCMGSIRYQGGDAQLRSDLVSRLFKNWNLNGPGPDLWAEIMGDYDIANNAWKDASRNGATVYRWLRQDTVDQYRMIEYLLGLRPAYP